MKHKMLSAPLLFTVLLTLLAAFATPCRAEISKQQRQETYKQLEIFANILSILQNNYVEPIDTDKVIRGAISGLLYSLDPHSSYMRPQEFNELQEETEGEFSGIGIEITIKEGILTVISPIEGTPADKAGLKANDNITAINGKRTKEMGPMEAMKKLRGPKGSSVTISVYRKGWEKPKQIKLVRDIIPLQSVKASFLTPKIVYTRITNFQSHTTADYEKALQHLEKKGKIEGLILDLRNNPGGLLDQAVGIANIFIRKGVIVSTKGRVAEQDKAYRADGQGGPAYDFPMVVLVNEGTASASEIVAGALQDHRRGIIVGTRTFGKGSVQTIIPLPGGAGLRLTTARYFTPNGKSIQALGITPDIEVPYVAYQPDSGSNGEDNGQEHLREIDLRNHIPGSWEGHGKNPAKAAEDLKLQKKLAKDNQLRSALDILQGLNFYMAAGTETSSGQLR